MASALLIVIYLGLHEKLENDLADLEEMAREIKDYSEKIENSQEKLEAIECRIEELSKLKRKYGNSIEAILAFRDKALCELNAIQDGEAERLRLEVELVLKGRSRKNC